MIVNDSSCFLRTALVSNAVFSTVSGISFMIFSQPIAEMTGVLQPLILIFLGISLLIFAVGLMVSARREIMNLTEAWIAVGLWRSLPISS